MSGREKGVASQSCPNCGSELAVVAQPDGGISTETCGKCFPSATSEKASVQSTKSSRERGTIPTTQEAPSE